MQVLFRSFELDTGQIIIGHYVKENGYYMINDNPIYENPVTRHYIFESDGIKHEIAPEYLSINFENMIDKNGKKIFASLSEDGVGGDIITSQIAGISKGKTWKLVAYFKESSLWYRKVKTNVNEHEIKLPNQDCIKQIQVIGIHKGRLDE